MKKDLLRVLIFLMLAALLASCFDAAAEIPPAKPGQIECYSGGVLIYSGDSVGDVSSDTSSDAYIFTEAGSGKLKAVSGDCVVVFD